MRKESGAMGNPPATAVQHSGARHWAVMLAALLLTMAFFFGVLEGAARLYEMWNPPMRVDLGQGFDDSSRLFIPDPENPAMMVTNPNKTISFKRQSFGRIKPPRTLRIFVLGGSSVNFISEDFPLHAMALESDLPDGYRVESVNCGGLAYGSHRLVMITREILNYEPDFVVIYSGHNEFEELQQLHLSHVSLAPVHRLLSRSALYRLLRDLAADRQLSGLKNAAQQRKLAGTEPQIAKGWTHPFTPEELAGRMPAYRANLEAIIRMCRSRNVEVVLGTVASNLVNPNLIGDAAERYEREVRPLFDRGDYAGAMARGRQILADTTPRHQSSDLENGIIRDLSRELNVPLADVETIVAAAEPHGVPGETLFGDHCHLNQNGNWFLLFTYETTLRELIHKHLEKTGQPWTELGNSQ